MRKILALAVVATLGLGLAGCETARQDRVAGGALIGAGTGAQIGGLAGRWGGAGVNGLRHGGKASRVRFPRVWPR